MKKLILFINIFFLLYINSLASAESNDITVHLSTKNVNQGHSLAIYIASKHPLVDCKGFLLDRVISFFNVYRSNVYRAIFGIDIAEPAGRKKLFIKVKTVSGKVITKNIEYQVMEYVFRQTTTDGRIYQAAVVFTPQMLRILQDRRRLAEDARYLRNILKTESQIQNWIGNFSFPIEWLTYRNKTVNGKVIREPREKPIFGAKRINITRNGQRVSYHRGTDYVNFTWTKVYAAAGGKVLTARHLRTHGNTIVIDHGQGILTLYCHLHKLKAKEGETVKKGEFIAYVGSTGLSTGSHLHFELRAQNVSISPHEWYAFSFYFPLFY